VSWWWLVGCGPAAVGVKWDAATSADAGEDVVLALFALGLQETDGAVLRAVHPTGSALVIRAVPRQGQGSPKGWTADTEDRGVVEVVAQEASSSSLELQLVFPTEGSTDLVVVDRSGNVVDTERLEVRDAQSATVFSWEDLQRDLVLPLDTLHVVEETDATFVVQWSTSDGAEMSGGDILSVEGPASLRAEAGFDGANEILKLAPGPGSTGSYEVVLSAVDTEIRTLPVVVHPRREVDDVSLELGQTRFTRVQGGYASGTVHAVVRAGGVIVSGAEVWFTWSDGAGEGDTLDFSADEGPATTVEACFDDVCRTFPLPAGVVGVRDQEASLSDGGTCGCGHTGGAPLGIAGVAALAGLRRRRR